MKRGDALARRYARALFQLGVERGDAARVLDGDINAFLEAALASRVGGGADEEGETTE